MYHGVRGFDNHPVTELSMQKGKSLGLHLSPR